MKTQQDHSYTQNEGNQRANIAFMEGWEHPAGACATAEWRLLLIGVFDLFEMTQIWTVSMY